MTPGAGTVVNERWLLIEEGAYARQLAGFGGLMDRMILGQGRRHEPSRRINHVRGIILGAAISRGPALHVGKLSGFLAIGLERRVRGRQLTGSVDGVSPLVESHAAPWTVSLQLAF